MPGLLETPDGMFGSAKARPGAVNAPAGLVLPARMKAVGCSSIQSHRKCELSGSCCGHRRSDGRISARTRTVDASKQLIQRAAGACPQITTALLAECLGSMMFSFIGSASLYVATVALAPPPNVVMAAFANGLTLGIVSAPLNTTETPLLFARGAHSMRTVASSTSRGSFHMIRKRARQAIAHARAVATPTLR